MADGAGSVRSIMIQYSRAQWQATGTEREKNPNHAAAAAELSRNKRIIFVSKIVWVNIVPEVVAQSRALVPHQPGLRNVACC